MRTIILAGLALCSAGLGHADVPCQPDDALKGITLGAGWTSCTSTLANGEKVRIITGAPVVLQAAPPPVAQIQTPVQVNPNVDIRVILPRQVFLPNRATPRYFGSRRAPARHRFLRERRPRRVRF